MPITKEEMAKTAPTAAQDEDAPKDVNARFRPSELAAMKKRTGVTTDAGAVAAFCRINLANGSEAR